MVTGRAPGPLVANAPHFGFHPYAKEEWHWDYH
jgi:hypothetical protein